ncbi:MAG: hypothetical protein EA362_04530 [Saprospirales bacterium]|nr:MAG: hypothetical protein EA362_04530 [Saprospirales bacterium]
MNSFAIFSFFVPFLFLFANSLTAQEKSITPPEEFFGFQPGDDRKLFNYEEMIAYLQLLEEQSDKIQLIESGETELGRPMYLCFVSSSNNINQLEELKGINRQLALNYQLEDKERDELIKRGKAFFFMTLSMHSTEVGMSQAAPLIIYELLTSDDPIIEKILENTVYMITPSHNPDGMNMIVEHYKKYLGTKYEGSFMPGVYHKYAGHNINRDFITLLLKENQMVADAYSTEWFPQLMVERHQMGSLGPRYYISPPSDPIAENIQAGLYNWKRIFGSRSITDMTRNGLKGVSVNYHFDFYWPGHTTTGAWKGIIAMLSEAASVRIATPIYIEPNEIRFSGKGLSSNDMSINMPDPWKGGWWRLSDIVEYERVNTISYLHTAAIHKNEILLFRNELTKEEVRRGKESAPFYYILPQKQHDQSEWSDLVNLLMRHGISVFQLTDNMHTNQHRLNEGDIVIPLAQPYRAFIKEIMETQTYPIRTYTLGGPVIQPYDINSWSLPLHRGVNSIEINDADLSIPAEKLQLIQRPFHIEFKKPQDFDGFLLPVNNNHAFKTAFQAKGMGMTVNRLTEEITIDGEKIESGSFYIPLQSGIDQLLNELNFEPVFYNGEIELKTIELSLPRIALVESWFHDMDAGWTRLLLDTYQLPYQVLRPVDLRKDDWINRYDVLLFPDQNATVLRRGRFSPDGIPPPAPTPYTKGIENEGMQNIFSFINKGGKIVSWGRSTDLFLGNQSLDLADGAKEEFRLPVRNIATSLSEQGLSVTGSFLNLNFNTDHHISSGMPESGGVFHRGNPVFATELPVFDMDRRVLATFANKNVLLSGYAVNEELLVNHPALVWTKKGDGELYLFSFSPVFRGSTPATFKLLWNSILPEF